MMLCVCLVALETLSLIHSNIEKLTPIFSIPQESKHYNTLNILFFYLYGKKAFKTIHFECVGLSS